MILRNHELSENIAKFLITCLEKSTKGKFGYGLKLSQTRMKRQKILLPVDNNYNPDWEFMNNYILKKIKKSLLTFVTYLTKKEKELQNNLEKEISYNNLLEYDWKDYSISQIFYEIKRGKRLIKRNQQPGKIPYISSKSEHNGIDSFISNNKNIRKNNNCLTIANSGSVGATFFHPYEFIASDHVTMLKSDKMDKYAYLFLSQLLKIIGTKYSFNREINDKRIIRERIYLPTNKHNEINYILMSNYMKTLELKKTQEAISFYKSKLKRINSQL